MARRVQRSPKPTEQVNLMSLKMRRDRHHKNLTRDWTGRKQTMCFHPSYKGQRKGKTQTRRVNGKMSQGIFELHNALVSGKPRTPIPGECGSLAGDFSGFQWSSLPQCAGCSTTLDTNDSDRGPLAGLAGISLFNRPGVSEI